MKLEEAVEKVIQQGGFITRQAYEEKASPTGYDILFQIVPETQRAFKGHPVLVLPFVLALLFLGDDSPLWGIAGWQFTENDLETTDWVVVNF